VKYHKLASITRGLKPLVIDARIRESPTFFIYLAKNKRI